MAIKHRNYGLTFFSLVFSLLFISSAYGATYFVDTNGNDTNNGSSSNPYRTVAKALAISSYGDTVSINDGTYSEKQLVVPVGVNLTSTAKNSSKVKLQPSVNLSTNNPFILLSSAPGTNGNQTISYLEIDGINGSNRAYIGISIRSRNHVRVTRCDIHDFYGKFWAAAVEAVSAVNHGGTYWTSFWPKDPGPDGDDSNILNLWPNNPVIGVEIDNNTIDDCGYYDESTDRTGSVTLFLLKDSRIHHNRFSNPKSRGEFIVGRGFGMRNPGKTAMLDNVDIYNNDFAIGEPYGNAECNWSIEAWLWRNGCEIYNNTFSGQYGSSFYSITYGKNTSVYNNQVSITPAGSRYGIGIEFNQQSYGEVTNNYIENAKWGIVVGFSFNGGNWITKNVTVSDNVVYNSKYQGLRVDCLGSDQQGFNATVTNIDINNNYMVGNSDRGTYGIQLKEEPGASSCSLSNVSVKDNNITKMTVAAGVTSGTVPGVLIDGNNFYENASNRWQGSNAVNTITTNPGLPAPDPSLISNISPLLPQEELSPPTLSIIAN